MFVIDSFTMYDLEGNIIDNFYSKLFLTILPLEYMTIVN